MVSPFCEYGSTLPFLQVIIEHEERYRWGSFYKFLIYRWVRKSFDATSQSSLTLFQLLQMAEGLDHLHEKGIVHGDLHPVR